MNTLARLVAHETEASSTESGAPDAIDQSTQNRYRVFKKNSPYLYDHVVTHSLLWPSLSVQFFPDLEVADPNPQASHDKRLSSSQLSHQRVLLGTFTLGQAVDAIHLYQIPYHRALNKSIDTNNWAYNTEKEEFELPKIATARPRVLQLINHHGDVNTVRFMPQNPDVLASTNNVGDVCVYNRTKHATLRKPGEELKANEPQLRLLGQKAAGPCETRENTDIFALDWNKQAHGVVVSASMAGRINVHDVKGSYTSRDAENLILATWDAKFAAGVNAVEWVQSHDSVFVSADDSGALSVLDTRADGTPLMAQKGTVPKNSVSVHPTAEFCVATGDAHGQLDVWDLRALQESARSVPGHTDAISQVKWHPQFPSVVGLASADRLVRIFDVAEPSEPLIFSHEGHMLGVNAFDWSMHEDWMVASVADDNSLHVWQPSHRVLKRKYSRQ